MTKSCVHGIVGEKEEWSHLGISGDEFKGIIRKKKKDRKNRKQKKKKKVEL